MYFGIILDMRDSSYQNTVCLMLKRFKECIIIRTTQYNNTIQNCIGNSNMLQDIQHIK